MSRNASGARGSVTLQALAGRTVESRSFDGPLAHGVEIGPFVWVYGAQLEHLAVLHPADVDIVVEIDSARCVRRDPALLQAGLREHQHLRARRDLQLLEHGVEIAARLAEFHPQLAGRNFASEAGDGVVDVIGRVPDGGPLKVGQVAGVAGSNRGKPGHQHHEPSRDVGVAVVEGEAAGGTIHENAS